MSFLAINEGGSPDLTDPGRGVESKVVEGDTSFGLAKFSAWGVETGILVRNVTLPTDESNSSSISPFPKLGTPCPSPDPLPSSERDEVYFSNVSRILYNSLGSRVSATSGSGSPFERCGANT